MEKVRSELMCKLLSANTERDLTNAFETLATDEARVGFVLKLMHDYNTVPDLVGDAATKNSKESERYREKGNEAYVSRQPDNSVYLDAAKLYTKSVATAPYPSKELGLAYANRSAVLFRVKKFAECVQDIKRALEFELSKSVRTKLETRLAKCFASLNDPNDNTSSFLHHLTTANMSTTVPVPTLGDSCNPEFPCASNSVTVTHNERYGRHVVANRTITPGEIVAIEKPYSVALCPENMYTHCTNCLEVCWAGIPCQHCVYAIYCSEACKAEAWRNFHDIECPVVPLLLKYGFTKMQLFSLRLVVQALREHRLIELRTEAREVEDWADPRTKGFSPDNKWHSERYRTVYSLVTNTEKRPTPELFRQTLSASFILCYLATRTLLFGKKLYGDPLALSEQPDVTFIGGLLLRHQQIIASNAHSFTEQRQFQQVERGIAAMPFLSLINHSCDPNVFRHSKSKVIILYAIRPIEKGEQVLDCYGQHYALTPKPTRQAELFRQYLFKCDCLPCLEDWPLHADLSSFQRLVTRKEDLHRILKVVSQDALNAYATGDEDVLSEPGVKERLCEMIRVLHKFSPQPCWEMSKITETLKLAYGYAGNRFDMAKAF